MPAKKRPNRIAAVRLNGFRSGTPRGCCASFPPPRRRKIAAAGQRHRPHHSERQCQARQERPVDHHDHDRDPDEHHQPRQHDPSGQRIGRRTFLPASPREGEGDGRARGQPANQAGHRAPPGFTQRAHRDVAHLRQRRDQDDQQPELPRIERVQRIQRAVGEEREDDERRDEQLERGVDVLLAEPRHQPVEGRLEGEDRGRRDAEPHGQPRPPEHDEAAEQYGHQRRDLGGKPRLRGARPDRDRVPRQHESGRDKEGDREDPRRAHLQRQPGRHRARDREQDEGADPAQAHVGGLALLALDPDQGADEERDGKITDNDGIQTDGLCSVRRALCSVPCALCPVLYALAETSTLASSTVIRRVLACRAMVANALTRSGSRWRPDRSSTMRSACSGANASRYGRLAQRAS